ncbi:MAG TPA: class I SAM-dependent methyltransferase [Ignavibacteriaceae bacterium]|nr:class I SAM-dependent methyltransferase [Ignavibacteriaceae bacterium]
MNFTDNFSDSSKANLIFMQKNVPVFQNKVYSSKDEAVNAKRGKVELVQSTESGFVFNKEFNSAIMNYDENYQNEQSNSLLFRKHLKEVLQLLKNLGIDGKKIVEIGCGKGFFFDIMLKDEQNCWGFDPTYEGSNKRIIKEYFGSANNNINADVVILRHTLEHIENPFTFLHSIAKANNYKGYLFVEVPTFDWIINKNAFWDIFYEHCNYFTEDTLSIMFEKSTTGSLFGGQYIFLWADLSQLRNLIPKNTFRLYDFLTFETKLNELKDIVQNNGELAIWGAGAKGSTFLNLLDPERKYIKYVIDINPAKHHKYIAGTGHPILPPDKILSTPVDGVIVMNNNYISEISSMIKNNSITLYNL